MGRLFDAVGALCGLRAVVTYEGQAAVELEALATSAGVVSGGYPLPLDGARLDGRALIQAVTEDRLAGVSPALVAARFHAGVASGTAEACARWPTTPAWTAWCYPVACSRTGCSWSSRWPG